jgi:ribonuclease J
VHNIPIYTSDIGKSIIEDYFERHTNFKESNYDISRNIHVVEPLKSQKISEHILLTPFKVFSSIPNSLGFIFNSKDGGIIYVDNFMIAPNVSKTFKSDLMEINKITNSNNLLLISGVGQVGKNDGFTNTHHRCASFFEKIVSDVNGKIIVGFFDDDIYKILTLINVAYQKNIPICIYSRGFANTFEFLVSNNYFSCKKDQFISDEQIENTQKCIVIVVGAYHNIFTKLDKIILDDDPKIHLTENDAFVFAAPTVAGYEKLEAEMFDNVYRTNVKSICKLDKNILQMVASNEDHKMLINVLQPKFIIPINDLYINMKEYQNIAVQSGYDRKNIFLLENGQSLSLEDANHHDHKKFIKLEPQFISNQGALDLGATSLFEREQMKEAGVVLVNLFIDKKTKQIERSNFDPIGVINLSEENKKIVSVINEEATKQINTLISEAIDKNELDIKNLKLLIKKLFTKHYDHKFNKKPLVITTIIIRKENYIR